jgi:hypothetical protein
MCFTQPNAVQLRVTLAQIEPPIWRRLVVPWSFTLGQLHQLIQAAFGWWDYHLHQFVIGGLRYGDVEQIGEPEFEGDSRGFDETEVRLLDFDHSARVAFTYEYDFGDSWEHIVEFEQLLTLEPPPSVAAASMEVAPGHRRMSAGSTGTRAFSKSWPIVGIPSIAILGAGPVDTSIRNGSTWR